MGFDTSYHPVDMRLIESRLLPYLAGHGDDGDIEDLVERAVRIRRTRFRAKAWALGVSKAVPDAGESAFDSQLHLWGRPFFIIGEGVGSVVEGLRRYLSAPDLDAVDAIAGEMAGRIDPALSGRVEPDPGGQLPDDAALADSFRLPLRILRGAAVALRAGQRTVRHPRGEREFDAARLLAQEVPFNLLDFAAALLPGWMSRGYTWPTRLCADAGLPAEGFTDASALTGLLREQFPALDWPVLPDTIVANYTVGGLVPAPDVPTARAQLARERARLDCDGLELRKLDEALGVAEHLGFAFCEATEIYSGFEGNLN
ncbi:hypothetical protein [Streptomyces sp. DH24]|uniref:hypothetical protein n=1 Tax=Streptomyces sp. DH24 TaxID=3040123 RepID=UPI0024418AE7|nr:hypothetical protein [Streptomyces sp. DH24]MDG9718725.1 hypothetical protein [Streptomyces sp. DH24]